MKYLVSLIIAVPLFTSCTVIQEEYYEQPGYYTPPPRVEVEPNYDNRHDHGHAGYRRHESRGRVYHGHADAGPGAVIINPGRPGPQIVAQPNVHGHNGPVVRQPQPLRGPVQAQPNVHGHNGPVVRQPQPARSPVQVQPNVHGHNGPVVRQPQPARGPVQVKPNVPGKAVQAKKAPGHNDPNEVKNSNSSGTQVEVHGHN